MSMKLLYLQKKKQVSSFTRFTKVNIKKLTNYCIYCYFYIVTNKVKKIVTKKVKVSSESEEEEEALLKLTKKKVPSQLSQNTIKIITRKVAPKPKTSVKVKPVIIESDDDSPPPTELKIKSSVFDRLGVGDVSSTTPNFDINNSSSDSKKVLFYLFMYIHFVFFY